MINEKELDVILEVLKFNLYVEKPDGKRIYFDKNDVLMLNGYKIKQELKEKGILKKSALEEFMLLGGSELNCPKCFDIWLAGEKAIKELQGEKE